MNKLLYFKYLCENQIFIVYSSSQNVESVDECQSSPLFRLIIQLGQLFQLPYNNSNSSHNQYHVTRLTVILVLQSDRNTTYKMVDGKTDSFNTHNYYVLQFTSVILNTLFKFIFVSRPLSTVISIVVYPLKYCHRRRKHYRVCSVKQITRILNKIRGVGYQRQSSRGIARFRITFNNLIPSTPH